MSFEVRRIGNELEFVIAGQPLFRGIVQVLYGVERQSMGQGPKMAFLLCGVVSEGLCRLVLSAEWGVIHGMPKDWPQKFPVWETPVPNLKLEGKATLPAFVDAIEKHSAAVDAVAQNVAALL